MKRVPLHEPLSSDILTKLRDYWLQIRSDRPMPSRDDIDPIDIPKLLPHITLTEVFHGPLRFRYRLLGTEITALSGRDVTGNWIDRDLYGDNLERMLLSFQQCVQERQPVAIRQKAQFPERDWVVIEALLLPLGHGEVIEMILSGLSVLSADVQAPPGDTSFLLDWKL